MNPLKIPTLSAFGRAHTSPDELYGSLFDAVQTAILFKDSKTFADSIPKCDPGLILEMYGYQKNKADFNLKKFVLEYFEIPEQIHTRRHDDEKVCLEDHIDRLWTRLSRFPEDQEKGGSLLALPKPYIVPGGRFREIYYWDSYFTMLGLAESSQAGMIRNMIHNFSHLIDHFGHIPCGNRTYYLSRSQPPFFSLMVQLYAKLEGKEKLLKYMPQLKREYDYWMNGSEQLTEPYATHRRVVMMPDGSVLNRYWDDRATPRPEAYHEDVDLAREAKEKFGTDCKVAYRHIRAAAESGWDFSSRWMADGQTFSSIQTTNIIPVDLNCLLYNLENVLAEGYFLSNNYEMYRRFNQKAQKRQAAINTYFWDSKKRFYRDYDFCRRTFTKTFSLAGVFPLFFKLADRKQAHFVDAYIRLNFMRSGGVLTTLKQTGQQWDVPNGWAPLQWIVYQGLRNYQFNCAAGRLRDNWMHLIEKHYYASGRLLEKYNIINTNLEACDGEYVLQEGFGWTNAIYLKMKKEKNL
jgi:alpha,alpha-trehalase